MTEMTEVTDDGEIDQRANYIVAQITANAKKFIASALRMSGAARDCHLTITHADDLHRRLCAVESSRVDPMFDSNMVMTFTFQSCVSEQKLLDTQRAQKAADEGRA